jgi:hypothetical protein
VTSVDLHCRSLKFESYGEPNLIIICPGCLWWGLRFERADMALLTICTRLTTSCLLLYKVRLVVLSSTQRRMLLRAVYAWGCCAHWSIAKQVVATKTSINEIIMIMSWCIWKERNVWRFNNDDPSVQHCKSSFISEFALVILRTKSQKAALMSQWLENLS